MVSVRKRNYGYSLIAIGLTGIIHYKVMAVTMIIVGLLNIDHVYEQALVWLKRTFKFNGNEDEDWLTMDNDGKVKMKRKK